jgi:magnesium-transporting ATPase (P-type)
MFVNPWLWGAIGVSVMLQVAVVNVGLLNVAFGTVPLSLEQWLVCAAMASLVLWVSELRKWLWRTLRKRRLPDLAQQGAQDAGAAEAR